MMRAPSPVVPTPRRPPPPMEPPESEEERRAREEFERELAAAEAEARAQFEEQFAALKAQAGIAFEPFSTAAEEAEARKKFEEELRVARQRSIAEWESGWKQLSGTSRKRFMRQLSIRLQQHKHLSAMLYGRQLTPRQIAAWQKKEREAFEAKLKSEKEARLELFTSSLTSWEVTQRQTFEGQLASWKAEQETGFETWKLGEIEKHEIDVASWEAEQKSAFEADIAAWKTEQKTKFQQDIMKYRRELFQFQLEEKKKKKEPTPWTLEWAGVSLGKIVSPEVWGEALGKIVEAEKKRQREELMGRYQPKYRLPTLQEAGELKEYLWEGLTGEIERWKKEAAAPPVPITPAYEPSPTAKMLTRAMAIETYLTEMPYAGEVWFEKGKVGRLLIEAAYVPAGFAASIEGWVKPVPTPSGVVMQTVMGAGEVPAGVERLPMGYWFGGVLGEYLQAKYVFTPIMRGVAKRFKQIHGVGAELAPEMGRPMPALKGSRIEMWLIKHSSWYAKRAKKGIIGRGEVTMPLPTAMITETLPYSYGAKKVPAVDLAWELMQTPRTAGVWIGKGAPVKVTEEITKVKLYETLLFSGGKVTTLPKGFFKEMGFAKEPRPPKPELLWKGKPLIQIKPLGFEKVKWRMGTITKTFFEKPRMPTPVEVEKGLLPYITQSQVTRLGILPYIPKTPVLGELTTKGFVADILGFGVVTTKGIVKAAAKPKKVEKPKRITKLKIPSISDEILAPWTEEIPLLEQPAKEKAAVKVKSVALQLLKTTQITIQVEVPEPPATHILPPPPKRRRRRKKVKKKRKRKKAPKTRIGKYEILYPVATTSEASKYIMSGLKSGKSKKRKK